MRWVERCNAGGRAGLVPLRLGAGAGAVAGDLRPEFAERLGGMGGAFALEGGGAAGAELRLAGRLQVAPLEEASEAVGRAMAELRDLGVISGWRDELYPISAGFHKEPLLLLERAAVPFFGVQAYGVHVCAFVRDAGGGLSMWVARRSLDKPTWPGMLDHLVAGGQPHGISPGDNVVKECMEEANLAEDLARHAIPAGAVSYEYLQDEGLKRDVLFCYDLELPASFEPSNNDGEVAEFMLWPIERVMRTIAETDEFKPNCNLVIIDFLIRHGCITPDHPEYLELVNRLRSGDCS